MMCGCSGRTTGQPVGPGWPWRHDRGNGSSVDYGTKEEADRAVVIHGGQVLWLGEGPEPAR
jgi:hypothetical protein